MLGPNLSLVNGSLVGSTTPKPKHPVFKSLPKGKDDISKAIRCFLSGGTGKFGNYVAVENALVYRTLAYVRTDYELRQDIIALRITKEREIIYLGNSSILPNIGRSVSFGNERRNRSETDIQRALSRIIPMLPFSVFTQAGLNLTKVNILERGPEEVITRTESKYDSKTKKDVQFPVEVHFTGASLFEVDGKYFLFDVDRREVQHRIFNPFLVQLNNPIRSIREAYEALKPDEVIKAEAEGLEVLRQGEWFFIPVKGKFQAVKPTTEDRWQQNLEKGFRSAELRAGNNRPNRVSRVAGAVTKGRWGDDLEVHAVSGFVEHTGREHARLDLKGWYKPIPNTSIQSFTITGDVD